VKTNLVTIGSHNIDVKEIELKNVSEEKRWLALDLNHEPPDPKTNILLTEQFNHHIR